MKRDIFGLAILAFVLLTIAPQAWAQSGDSTEVFTSRAVRVGVAPRIEELAKRTPAPKAYGAQHEVYNESIPDFLRGRQPIETKADPLQQKRITRNAPAASLSFDGYANADNSTTVGFQVSPPDVNGDIGLNHYVQYVNLGWVFYNKSNGSVAGGPFAGNTFWQGFGGVCDSQNAGDPIVLYDHIANQWVFSQFTDPSNPDGHQCFAISQGSDPAGPYFLYDFVVSPGAFNDYPKIGLWTDGSGQSAYHMMTNNFTASFSGVQVTAFERDAMLNGQSAQQVSFNLSPSATPTAFGIQPAHLEGPTAPAGTCPLYAQALDVQTWGGSGPDGYRFWEFCTNWNNTNLSTFSETAFVSTSAFDSELCGFSRDCIQQPGTTQNLDVLGQFTMYRFQNRFINGNHLAVVNHTVDTGGDIAGIRWAQFDINSASSITLADTGTLGPGDGISRWVGSIAMDGDGNIGLSYTRSNNSVFPSVYFTGRETTDPAGTLQTESSCVNGTGSQLGSNRWVDYSSISVDPVDNCTFWLTNEYVQTTGTVAWKTRICSFSFPSCGGTPNTAPSVNITSPANGSNFDEGISVAFSGTATDAEDGNIAANLSWTSSINGSIGSGASFSTSSLSVGTHTITASVTDSGGLPGSDAISITIDPVVGNTAPSVNITAPANGSNFDQGVSVAFSGTAIDAEDGNISANLSWSSSIDGNIGSGASFSTSSLSLGTHTITASVTDSGGLPGSDAISITINAVGGGCTDCIDWNVTGTVSYSNQDASGNITVEDGGDTVFLQQNTWRRTTQTFTVTANTVLEFDFQSTSQGEIHGIGFDENTSLNDATRIFQVFGTQNWNNSNHDFDDYTTGELGTFRTYQIPVGQYYTGNSMFLVLVNDKDSGALTNTSRFRNVRVFEDTPGGGGCTVDDDFESGAAGWSNSAASTCSTGDFILGAPTQVTNSGVVTQVGGDHTSGAGTDALFTASNSSAGVNDVDGGVCILDSPTWSVTNASTLSVWYFHGQRDTGDDPGDDFFELEVSTNGGASYSSIVSIGDVRTSAAWTNATAQIPAGSSVRLRVQAADGSGPGDLVEGGIDDLSICDN